LLTRDTTAEQTVRWYVRKGIVSELENGGKNVDQTHDASE
jgi:hypothetical protein